MYRLTVHTMAVGGDASSYQLRQLELATHRKHPRGSTRSHTQSPATLVPTEAGGRRFGVKDPECLWTPPEDPETPQEWCRRHHRLRRHRSDAMEEVGVMGTTGDRRDHRSCRLPEAPKRRRRLHRRGAEGTTGSRGTKGASGDGRS